MDAHAFDRFLSELGSLSALQWQQLDHVRAHSGQATVASLIDAARAPTRCCPRCASASLHCHGHANGLARFRCVPCGRTFNDLTGTSLARLRKKARWLPYLQCMLDSHTVRRAADLVGVHRNTSFRWRHRFLRAVKLDRQWPLGPVTEADETYILESQKGSRTLTRPARRRGGVASKRGITHEHDCILVARDRTGRTIDAVTGRAPLKCAQLHQHLGPRLAPQSLRVTDGHPAYATFTREAEIAHAAVNQSAGARVDGELHVQNVNAYHARFKSWLRRFNGVASRYLGNYLGWRWAIDGKRITSPANFLVAMLRAVGSARLQPTVT
jgi:transposase-like protein